MIIGQINCVELSGVVTTDPKFVSFWEEGFVFNVGVTRNNRLNQIPIFIPLDKGKAKIRKGIKVKIEGNVISIKDDKHAVYAEKVNIASEKANEENISMLEGNLYNNTLVNKNLSFYITATLHNETTYSKRNIIPIKTDNNNAVNELIQTKNSEEITAIGELGVWTKKDDGTILRMHAKKIRR